MSLARPVAWLRATFDLFDTGGLYGASEDPLHELVVRQGQRAIAGADLLVFLVDGREGLVSGDQTIAQELRAAGLPVILAVNKTDDKRAQRRCRRVLPARIRAGRRDLGRARHGVGDLLDEIVKRLTAGAPARAAERRSGASRRR